MLHRFDSFHLNQLRGIWALALCALSLATAMQLVRKTEQITQSLHASVNEAKSKTPTDAKAQARRDDVSRSPVLEWPSRELSDELVRQAEEAARTHGLSLRTLSVSHQPASAHALGGVAFDMAASGPYGALKSWQADLQGQFSFLSLQSLRLMPRNSQREGESLPAASMPFADAAGALDAGVTWVLHVRD